ncbi:Aspartic peptidase domain [Pseudocohnilembus persalinus]|uniref:Aspartic peptidase domain n=1 Tax=Pseudocohnilembus persalinus TaxID=266149 RepID=A0A0V0QVL2_PSEPJ|nr:Aspartic peptidase domain [Pseudocohnilembus persalinus]|eukprot:KRX06254.1 Aspartic peptidase domain [Pseudocohnilembus persalinus]
MHQEYGFFINFSGQQVFLYKDLEKSLVYLQENYLKVQNKNSQNGKIFSTNSKACPKSVINQNKIDENENQKEKVCTFQDLSYSFERKYVENQVLNLGVFGQENLYISDVGINIQNVVFLNKYQEDITYKQSFQGRIGFGNNDQEQVYKFSLLEQLKNEGKIESLEFGFCYKNLQGILRMGGDQIQFCPVGEEFGNTEQKQEILSYYYQGIGEKDTGFEQYINIEIQNYLSRVCFLVQKFGENYQGNQDIILLGNQVFQDVYVYISKNKGTVTFLEDPNCELSTNQVKFQDKKEDLMYLIIYIVGIIVSAFVVLEQRIEKEYVNFIVKSQNQLEIEEELDLSGDFLLEVFVYDEQLKSRYLFYCAVFGLIIGNFYGKKQVLEEIEASFKDNSWYQVKILKLFFYQIRNFQLLLLTKQNDSNEDLEKKQKKQQDQFSENIGLILVQKLLNNYLWDQEIQYEKKKEYKENYQHQKYIGIFIKELERFKISLKSEEFKFVFCNNQIKMEDIYLDLNEKKVNLQYIQRIIHFKFGDYQWIFNNYLQEENKEFFQKREYYYFSLSYNQYGKDYIKQNQQENNQKNQEILKEKSKIKKQFIQQTLLVFQNQERKYEMKNIIEGNFQLYYMNFIQAHSCQNRFFQNFYKDNCKIHNFGDFQFLTEFVQTFYKIQEMKKNDKNQMKENNAKNLKDEFFMKIYEILIKKLQFYEQENSLIVFYLLRLFIKQILLIYDSQKIQNQSENQEEKSCLMYQIASLIHLDQKQLIDLKGQFNQFNQISEFLKEKRNVTFQKMDFDQYYNGFLIEYLNLICEEQKEYMKFEVQILFQEVFQLLKNTHNISKFKLINILQQIVQLNFNKFADCQYLKSQEISRKQDDKQILQSDILFYLAFLRFVHQENMEDLFVFFQLGKNLIEFSQKIQNFDQYGKGIDLDKINDVLKEKKYKQILDVLFKEENMLIQYFKKNIIQSIVIESLLKENYVFTFYLHQNYYDSFEMLQSVISYIFTLDLSQSGQIKNQQQQEIQIESYQNAKIFKRFWKFHYDFDDLQISLQKQKQQIEKLDFLKINLSLIQEFFKALGNQEYSYDYFGNFQRIQEIFEYTNPLLFDYKNITYEILNNENLIEMIFFIMVVRDNAKNRFFKKLVQNFEGDCIKQRLKNCIKQAKSPYFVTLLVFYIEEQFVNNLQKIELFEDIQEKFPEEIVLHYYISLFIEKASEFLKKPENQNEFQIYSLKNIHHCQQFIKKFQEKKIIQKKMIYYYKIRDIKQTEFLEQNCQYFCLTSLVAHILRYLYLTYCENEQYNFYNLQQFTLIFEMNDFLVIQQGFMELNFSQRFMSNRIYNKFSSYQFYKYVYRPPNNKEKKKKHEKWQKSLCDVQIIRQKFILQEKIHQYLGCVLKKKLDLYFRRDIQFEIQSFHIRRK